jgi:hypothetical protein
VRAHRSWVLLDGGQARSVSSHRRSTVDAKSLFFFDSDTVCKQFNSSSLQQLMADTVGCPKSIRVIVRVGFFLLVGLRVEIV